MLRTDTHVSSLIDVNKDEQLEMDEFVAALLVRGGFTYTQLAEAFNRLDLDGNSKISREEFQHTQGVLPLEYTRVRLPAQAHHSGAPAHAYTWRAHTDARCPTGCGNEQGDLEALLLERQQTQTPPK